ncbi:MAG: DNA primase [Candidatus Sericytochromatia bacterium]|nr:DNA primase [Candidatus Sericytochromatia bacterium]
MGLIAEDALASVRDRADLLEIIGEHVVLKRIGLSYRGLCPFHGEKSPSFYVHPDKGFFRCFGCGAGGNVFTFLMRLENLSFREVAERLAERYNVVLAHEAGDDAAVRDERKQLKELHALTQMAFARWLAGAEGAQARTYLAERGVDAPMIERFGLGYAPAGWDGLLKEMGRHGIDPDVLLRAGLVAERDSGGYYDRFRDRLIFPIANERGETVAFGGRILHGEGPKYLNSPETLLYNKSAVLYAMHLAKPGITAADGVLLVEGYMDVLRCHQAGFTHAVASSGTALTPHQAKMLVKHSISKRVWLAFDADRAGQEAIERGRQVLLDVTKGVGLRLYVVQVPEGKDPDAFILAKGSGAFGSLVAAAPTWTEYAIERSLEGLDLRERQAKADAVERLRPVLRDEHDPVIRHELVRTLAPRLGLPEETLRQGLWRGQRGKDTVQRTLSVKGTGWSAERTVLYFMGSNPLDRDRIRERLRDVPFGDPDHQRLWSLMDGLSGEATAWGWDQVLEGCDDMALHGRVAEILDGYDGVAGKETQILDDNLQSMVNNWLKIEARRLQTALMADSLAPEAQEVLMRQLQELKGRLLNGQRAIPQA